MSSGVDNSFKIEIGFKKIDDSTFLMRSLILNESSQLFLISASSNPYINRDSDVNISSSYTHISDPLMAPKLRMPWILLKQGESCTFEDEVNVKEVLSATISFDYFRLEDYPYNEKRLRKKNQKYYYQFSRIGFDSEFDLRYITLLDYYLMYYERGEISTVFREIPIK